MSLQVWLPLNNNLNNQGLTDWNPSIQNNTTATYVNGKIGKALNTGVIIMPANIASQVLNNSEFSYACWLYVKGATDSTTERAMIFGNNSPRRFSMFQYPSANDFHWSWYDMKNGTDTFLCGSVLYDVLPSNQWTHIAVTYKNPNGKIYINGELKTTFTGNYTGGDFNYDTQLIHNSPYHYLNDVRLYDHALSPKEVKQLSQGLVLHYKLSGIGRPNNIKKSTIIQRSSTITFDSSTREYTMVCPSNTSGWGVGLYINDTSIKWKSGQTWLISMDVYTPQQIGWNADINNKPDVEDQSSYTGNDYDITSERKTSTNGVLNATKTLKVGWNKIWFSQKAPTTYGLHNYSTNFGIVTTDIASGSSITVKVKNIKGEVIDDGEVLGPTPWIPNSADAEYTALGFNDGIEYDCSGFGNNGEQWAYDSYGSITFDSNTPRYTTCMHINNDAKNASSNNASGTRYIYGKCALTTPKELTISFWCKPVAGSQGSTYNGQFSTTNNSIGSSAGNDYLTSCFNHRDAGIDVNSSDGSTHLRLPITFTANEWHYYTFTYDGQTAKAYVDGVLKNTVSFTSPTTLCSMVAIVIGFSRAGGVWRSNNSYYSDFRIYTTALSADDILTLYNTAATIDNQGNLFAYEVVEG